MPDYLITVGKAEGVKCPRCWRVTQANNFDNLCNRCCDVLVHDHPDHDASVELRRRVAGNGPSASV